jgi:lipopolysaccharide transport system permease protein
MSDAYELRRNVPRPGMTSPRELWAFRELLRSFVIRDLKVKYQRSALGFLWTLLNPVLTAGVLIAVFSIIIRVQIDQYWAFLISGYFVWIFVSQMISAGTTILEEHAALRRNIAFPAELLIFGSTLSRLFEFVVELSLALIVLATFHHHRVPLSYLWLPLLVVFQALLATGLKMIVSVMSVFFFDVRHIISICILMLFYLSPVFYPLSLVPEGLRPLFAWNPLVSLLSLFHVVLYEGRTPDYRLLLEGAGWSLGSIFVGYAIFNRYKALFAEIV